MRIMSRHLPYRAQTTTGNQYDFEFPLHPDTAEPVQVANLLTAVLGAVDRELKLLGNVGNGDVLQGLAMALAVRTRMLGPRSGKVDALVRELLESALDAPVEPSSSNVETGGPREIH